MAMLLLHRHCTVTIAHSRTQDLAGVCRSADILCLAVGRPEMVKADLGQTRGGSGRFWHNLHRKRTQG